MNTGKTMLAMLTSLAAGAAIGALFAADKGSDSRKRILKKGEDLANALSDKIDSKFDELLTAITGKAKKTGIQDSQGVNK